MFENAFSYNDWFISALEIAWTKEKTLPFRQRQKQNLKTPYYTTQLEIANF